MLSSLMSSSANSRSSTTAPAASSAPADAATEASTASGSAQHSAGDVFAGQLTDAIQVSDAIVGDVFVDAEQQTETPAADASNEALATNVQTPAEPSAEEWLLAMLDQQLMQLQARETQIAATPGVTQTVDDAAVQVNSAATRSADAVEQFSAVKNIASLATENNVHKTSINFAAEKNRQLVKTFEVNGKAAVNAATASAIANAQPNADAQATKNAMDTSANNNASNNATNNSALLNNTSAAAITASLGSGSATTAAPNELAHNSNLMAPAAVNAAGDSNVARAAQSQPALHAPEAKWGEQLLHTLRDQVQVQIQQKIQNATIRLDPPELGSLEIYLSHESGRLTVNITASQADVARLIQTTSDRLRHELAGPQFTQVHVQTSADGQSGQQQSRERQRFFSDEQILANDPLIVGNNQQATRSGDVLVTV